MNSEEIRSSKSLVSKLLQIFRSMRIYADKRKSHNVTLDYSTPMHDSSNTSPDSDLKEIVAILEEGGPAVLNCALHLVKKKDTADNTSYEVKDIADAVINIISSIENISAGIKSVMEISKHTNTLALETAIEAARTEKHENNFQFSTADIQRLAEEINRLPSEMDKFITSSTRVLDMADILIKNIIPKIQKTAELVSKISHSANGQQPEQEEINDMTDQPDKAMQTDTAAASGKINKNLSLLQRPAGNYKIH